MSIFNALYTADSGMNAQSTAFTNLSNNIANSQTTGYKATDTSFQDFVANSLSSYTGQAVSDGVGAVSTSQTQKQGTISTSTNSLAVAISGNGFFDVSQVSGQATSGKTSFSSEQYFTRNGDFSTDKDGYLVNTSGYYLNGYMADPTTGTLSSDLTQINVSNIAFRPTETTTLTMSGGLSDSGYSTTQTVYDSTGQKHTLQLDWTQDSSSTTTNPVWDVSVAGADSTANGDSTNSTVSVDSDTSSYKVTFDSSGNLESVTNATTGAAVGNGYSGSAVSLPITLSYTGTSSSSTVPAGQSIALSLGDFGSSSGLTTSAANSTTPTITSDSATSATYEGITMQTDGSIMATFSNGDTQLVGKIALASFNNADGLMAVDGQAYVATSDSGSATVGVVGNNGTGTLETASTESSTTDLTSDLSSLIVTQEAYTANTKVVTTADSLLQATIAMIQ
ncbi:flagellar hook protein FlgE [Acetobacter estunensis]|uniref:flagellar hook protein FlgE n=1 Tax=Acetobacter estunensis TaxID=104097 RepID=UPI001C2D764C|nr:flagellar hook-basal body complex protein [Acetobacter estunensis]MBV1836142.1 flagellar hook-basal body complex protein [Acetobacter estunensis]